MVLAINYQPKVGLMTNEDLCGMQRPGAAGWHPLQHAAMAEHERHTCSAVTCGARLHAVLLRLMPAALQVMMDFLREWEEKLQIKITCSQVSLAGSGLA